MRAPRLLVPVGIDRKDREASPVDQTPQQRRGVELQGKLAAHPAVGVVEEQQHVGRAQPRERPPPPVGHLVADVRGHAPHAVAAEHRPLVRGTDLLQGVEHRGGKQRIQHFTVEFVVPHGRVGIVEVALGDLRQAAVHAPLDLRAAQHVAQRGGGRLAWGIARHTEVVGERLLQGGRIGQPRRVAEVEGLPVPLSHVGRTGLRAIHHRRRTRYGIGAERVRTLRGRRPPRTAAGGAQQCGEHQRPRTAAQPPDSEPAAQAPIRFNAFHIFRSLLTHYLVHSRSFISRLSSCCGPPGPLRKPSPAAEEVKRQRPLRGRRDKACPTRRATIHP